ncbi:MAG: DUF2207 domain-containing protein [Chitinophagaceae bacterium]|nr:DUF2207 domain-containing protein [Chitinophagaceae bacterium]
MRSKIVLSLLLISFLSVAQKTKPPVYFYTTTSEKYFTDAAMDSLFESFSAKLFEEGRIPDQLFEKYYPAFKNQLIVNSKQAITQSFRLLEANQKKLKQNLPDAAVYANNKKEYTDLIEKQVRQSFSKYPFLSKYLDFNNSDRITFFNSSVRIGADGKLLVTENITINNGDGTSNYLYRNEPSITDADVINNEIKRGIFRTFPLYYVNKYKLFQNTTFKLKEVLRDGQPEQSRIEKKDKGLLVYTGNSNYYLPTGKYTYSITYESEKQLKFFKEYDELYWNVTGNSWSFRIDSAMCTVILPKGASLLSGKCYTGFQGSSSEDCSYTTTTVGDSTVVIFKSTKPFLPDQGLTIAISWPKGFVAAPGKWQQMKYYFLNNKAVFFLPVAALFSSIFCFIFWWRYGRDPKRGVIYPQFEPPLGFSPAALGYIYKQKFSLQLTAAMIVDAAVRNHIYIDVQKQGTIFKRNSYGIKNSDKNKKPRQSDYEGFLSKIKGLIGTTIEKGTYNSSLGSLNTDIEKFCKKNYKNKDGLNKNNYKGYFSLNNSYLIIPIFVCVVAAAWAIFDGLMISMIVKNFWQLAYFAAGILLCVFILKLYSRLLKAYSPAGRKLADHIEGFRMFLATADEKRFDLMNPPEKSLALYEKYLPFAIALDCEIAWGKKFANSINSEYLDGRDNSSFSQSFVKDNDNFSSSFASSFSGAISSASTPPSSSSDGGSSGGGSSGGGGGGGGGGGW